MENFIFCANSIVIEGATILFSFLSGYYRKQKKLKRSENKKAKKAKKQKKSLCTENKTCYAK